jgi:alanine dehydrogenase
MAKSDGAATLIGIPKETKDGEHRVALIPANVAVLVREGFRVGVERDAGTRAGYPDEEYLAAGAVLADAQQAYRADLIVKVKEPNLEEVSRLKAGQTLFAFVHLPGNPHLEVPLQTSGATVIAYELIEDEAGNNPILGPMSHIAGRLAPQLGAHYLLANNGGRGVLLGPVPGSPPSTAVVLGAGVVGAQAAAVAHGLGARVVVIDIDRSRASEVAARIGRLADSADLHALNHLMEEAALLIGAIRRPGHRADKVVTRKMLRRMRPGSVVVDVAIDEGGCLETSRPTSHSEPTYVECGVTHYCVPNIPSMAAFSASKALSAAVLPYVRALARGELDEREDLRRATFRPSQAGGVAGGRLPTRK